MKVIRKRMSAGLAMAGDPGILSWVKTVGVGPILHSYPPAPALSQPFRQIEGMTPQPHLEFEVGSEWKLSGTKVLETSWRIGCCRRESGSSS